MQHTNWKGSISHKTGHKISGAFSGVWWDIFTFAFSWAPHQYTCVGGAEVQVHTFSTWILDDNFRLRCTRCAGYPWDVVEASWNVMTHAQKPDFVFRRNGRVHLNRQGRQFSRLLAAEVCASAVVMLDTQCSEVVWRVLATHYIRQFPCASPCAITFQLDSTGRLQSQRLSYCCERCEAVRAIRSRFVVRYIGASVSTEPAAFMSTGKGKCKVLPLQA
jgi:hypothetical protein